MTDIQTDHATVTCRNRRRRRRRRRKKKKKKKKKKISHRPKSVAWELIPFEAL